jgi:hypothetical protein
MIDLYSKFLSLNWRDVKNGVVIIVLGVVLGALQQALSEHGLDFTNYDWNGILKLAFEAAGLYLSKNLLTTKDGKVLGAI